MIESEVYSEACETSKVDFSCENSQFLQKFPSKYLTDRVSDMLNSTISKEHFLLLTIGINKNFQSRSVVRNSNKNELIRYIMLSELKEVEHQKIEKKNG